MSSMVLELQQVTLKSDIPVSTLLLHAHAVASKLNLTDTATWITAEMRGYHDANVPGYRHISVSIEALNPYVGWKVVSFTNQPLEDAYKNQIMYDSVSSLESLLESVKRGGGRISTNLPSHNREFILKQMPVRMDVRAFVDPAAIRNILDGVRAQILDWTLELEREGVLGEGMAFTNQEKERAQAQNTNIQIGSIGAITGNIGGVTYSQHLEVGDIIVGDFTRDFTNRVTDFVSDLRGRLESLPREETGEILAAIDAVQSEAAKETPDESTIKRGLRIVATAALSLTSFATQALINSEIGKLLGAH